jgi:hypothetical protein
MPAFCFFTGFILFIWKGTGKSNNSELIAAVSDTTMLNKEQMPVPKKEGKMNEYARNNNFAFGSKL